MKTTEEIQRAHDMLVALILREVPVIISAENLDVAKIAASVLCWILADEHPPGAAFAEVLAEVERKATAAGYTLIKAL